MLQVALVSVGLLAAQAGDSSPTPQDLQTYEALKLKAGQDPPRRSNWRSGARRAGSMPSGSST